MQFTSAQITQIVLSAFTVIGGLIVLITNIVQLNRAIKELELAKQKAEENRKSGLPTEIPILKTPKRLKIRAFIGFSITAVAAIFLVTPLYTKFYVDPYINILSPGDNDLVYNTITVTGKFRNIDLRNQFIWVAVYPYNEGKYFLERHPAYPDIGKSEWTNTGTALGANKDSGGKVDIIVLLVDEKTATYTAIEKYVNDPNSHGLDKLPEGSVIRQKATVFIKKS